MYDGEFAGYRIASADELDTALREAVVAVDANVLLDLYRFRYQTSKNLIEFPTRPFGSSGVQPARRSRATTRL
ncbi:hypothetical protein [Actinosynnema sp. NPDC020468]|uniref:hypothetical protein n=1 Tax=Actinosynnema sp. NPDC020468 TaxID=3154488 RepID=UPI0033D88FB1